LLERLTTNVQRGMGGQRGATRDVTGRHLTSDIWQVGGSSGAPRSGGAPWGSTWRHHRPSYIQQFPVISTRRR